MNTCLTVILSKGKEHLCYEDEDCLVDVSYPMMTFTAGEDEFEIVPVGSPGFRQDLPISRPEPVSRSGDVLQRMARIVPERA